MPGVCDWDAIRDGALWKDEEGLGAGRRVCACLDTSLFGLPFIRY